MNTAKTSAKPTLPGKKILLLKHISAYEARSAESARILSHPTRVSGMIERNIEEILLHLADFALQEQPEDNLMVAGFRAW